jgi:cardiolipin synthase
MVKRLGVAGFRPLLEAGVRVYEWNGPMLHAKTAVADTRWARVGSSNLNAVSWMGNWELDVAVEDEGFAREMEASFEQDLEGATEIVLGPARRLRGHAPAHPASRRRRREGSAVATAGVLRLGNAVGAALGAHRILGPAETGVLVWAGVALFCAALIGALFPRVVLVPIAVVQVWLGVALLLRALRIRRARTEAATGTAHQDQSSTAPAARGGDGERTKTES